MPTFLEELNKASALIIEKLEAEKFLESLEKELLQKK